MPVRNARGQGVLMAVLVVGVLMATVVIFGARRKADVATLVGRLDAGQTAFEVLSAATKRVQSIYANEASCDPRSLNLRLSRLPALPNSPSTLGFGSSVAYAVAQPTSVSSTERYNLCSAIGSAGCRQLAINLENFVYVVTVGNVVGTNTAGSTDCPQDLVFRASVAINGSVFHQWSTLINVCTLASCAGDSFTGTSVTIAGSPGTTTACGFLPARYYGSLTNGTAVTTSNIINTDDIRWARRYLETGAGAVGETTHLVATDTLTNVNKSCSQASSSSQCFGRACIPAFDLNRDKTNNEADLAVLELYLRGYLLSLPVSLGF